MTICVTWKRCVCLFVCLFVCFTIIIMIALYDYFDTFFLIKSNFRSACTTSRKLNICQATSCLYYMNLSNLKQFVAICDDSITALIRS